MNPRERALNVFQHKNSDRPLIDFGSTVVSSITSNAYEKLRQSLLLDRVDVSISDHMMGVVTPEEDILKKWQIDFRRVAPFWPKPKVENGIWTDAWGIKRKQPRDFDYYDVVSNPLDFDHIDFDNVNWPDFVLDDEITLDNVGKRAKILYEETDYVIVGDLVARGIFGTGARLRGYSRFLMDIVSDRESTIELLSYIERNHLNAYTKYLELVGRYINVICFNDDYGTQDRMVMSPRTFREVFKPVLKTLFSRIRNLTDAKIFFHSCGSIYPIIEDLLDIGVNILNPIQPAATDMDPLKLKKEFGDRLVLWGGIDEQGLLTNGSPESIRSFLPEFIKRMSTGGGYVAAPSHNIQEDVPVENLIALFETLGDL